MFKIGNLIPLYQAYNLFNHLAISIILFLIIFQIIEYSKRINVLTIFFSLVPSIIYLFSIPTLYWHQNVFFTDQAVILPFVIFIYMELRYYQNKNLAVGNKLFLIFTVFWGTMTDWLFVFVIFISVILRMVFSYKKITFRRFIIDMFMLLAPFLLAIFLFLYQIISLYGLRVGFLKLFHVFLGRHIRGEDGIVTNFIRQHFIRFGSGYGITLCLLTAFCTLAFISYYLLTKLKLLRATVNTKILNVYLYLICLSIFPCLFQVYTFQQHSIVHDFSALKWAVPISLIPLSLIPIAVIHLTGAYPFRNIVKKMLFFFCLISLALFFNSSLRGYRSFFDVSSDYNKKIGELVKKNSNYRDMCFSFDFDIPKFPPQRLAYSEKRVYHINNFNEVKDKLSPFIKKGAIGKIFISEDRWAQLKDEAEKNCLHISKDSDYYICEIYKLDF